MGCTASRCYQATEVLNPYISAGVHKPVPFETLISFHSMIDELSFVFFPKGKLVHFNLVNLTLTMNHTLHDKYSIRASLSSYCFEEVALCLQTKPDQRIFTKGTLILVQHIAYKEVTPRDTFEMQ